VNKTTDQILQPVKQTKLIEDLLKFVNKTTDQILQPIQQTKLIEDLLKLVNKTTDQILQPVKPSDLIKDLLKLVNKTTDQILQPVKSFDLNNLLELVNKTTKKILQKEILEKSEEAKYYETKFKEYYAKQLEFEDKNTEIMKGLAVKITETETDGDGKIMIEPTETCLVLTPSGEIMGIDGKALKPGEEVPTCEEMAKVKVEPKKKAASPSGSI
jgi:hypothetical protein